MSAFRKFFARIPSFISLFTGIMLVCIAGLVMLGEGVLSFAYQNQSFVSSDLLGILAIGLCALLWHISRKAKPSADRPIWQLAVLFGLVLCVQVVRTQRFLTVLLLNIMVARLLWLVWPLFPLPMPVPWWCSLGTPAC